MSDKLGKVLCQGGCGADFYADEDEDIWYGKYICSFCLPLMRKCINCEEQYRARRSGSPNGQCDDCSGYEPPPKIYRGRKKQAPSGKWHSLRFTTLTKDEFTCRYCGRTPLEDKIKLHVDHIVPRTKGGGNEGENLVTACNNCNLGKSDVLLEQRLEQKIKERKVYEAEPDDTGNDTDGDNEVDD